MKTEMSGKSDALTVLSFGAVLWDIIDGKEYIGGAPFNLAAHLARCGARSYLMTRIGRDARGARALEEMEQLGVETDFAQIDPVRSTGWAKVELDEQGVPVFSFPDEPAYFFIEADDRTLSRLSARRFDVLCFGTLEQRGPISRDALYRVVEAIRPPWVFYDVNIRLDYYPEEVVRRSLSLSDVVKLNADEAGLLCARLYGADLPGEEFARRLQEDYAVRILCVTRGPDGCAVYADGRSAASPAPRVDVADTVGSGDAFSAGFLYRLCRGHSPFEAMHLANALGAFVASRRGAVPEYTDEIRRLLRA
jgi:fructokinase